MTETEEENDVEKKKKEGQPWTEWKIIEKEMIKISPAAHSLSLQGNPEDEGLSQLSLAQISGSSLAVPVQPSPSLEIFIRTSSD